MADPLSLVALGAAVGGAAGKFVEKAWNSGEKWITSYFADHRPKAIAQAQANSAEFLTVQSSRPAYGGPLTFGVRLQRLQARGFQGGVHRCHGL